MANLSLERLLFDPADVAAGPKIGSYIISASGDVIDDTSGALNVYLTNASIDVEVEKAKIWDGTDYLAINSDGSVNAVVTAANLDIRDLVYTSDSVTAHQGGTWSVETDFLPKTAIASSGVTVTDAGVALPETALSGRKRIMVQNVGTDPVFVGPTGVTVSSGLRVEKGATLSLEIGTNALYGIAASGKSVAVRVFEQS